MTVLISTKRGLINAVVEPRFQEIVTGYLVAVGFSDYDDVEMLSSYLKGDVLFGQNNRMVTFKSLIQIQDPHRKLQAWKTLNHVAGKQGVPL
jgi:hypothetical protein